MARRKMKRLAIALCILFLHSCAKPVFKSKWIKEQSPETFVTRFETSKGTFDILVTRNSSPHAVDRYYQLVKHHFFDKGIFYRVVPNFVAQFGTSDTIKINHWNKHKVPDEVVVKGNARGSLSFATDGKETRGSELFINLKNNNRLDTVNSKGVVGFPTFGNVTRGMDVVDSLYAGYGNAVFNKLDTMYASRAHFLAIFPKLDLIEKVYILK